MTNSSTFFHMQGDLRASKGAYLFIPKGTNRYLKVELETSPGDGFLSQHVEIRAHQNVSAFLETSKRPVGFVPEHGVPEEISGTLHHAPEQDQWHLETEGLTIRVSLPTPPSQNEVRAYCQMSGPLTVESWKPVE